MLEIDVVFRHALYDRDAVVADLLAAGLAPDPLDVPPVPHALDVLDAPEDTEPHHEPA